MNYIQSYIEVEKDLVAELYEIYRISMFHETKPIEAIGLKLTEEVGELAEQILVNQGHINKPLKEPIEGEVADILNCVLCVLFKAYPDLNVYEVLAKLGKAMSTKNKKWLANVSTTSTANF